MNKEEFSFKFTTV